MTVEDLWVESVHRYHARRLEQVKDEWRLWHLEQIERHRNTFSALIARHEREVARLSEEPVEDDLPRAGAREKTAIRAASDRPSSEEAAM
jgi:hypothetical protein